MKQKLRAGLTALLQATACALLPALLPAAAQATEVNVVGLFPGKAIVSINGGAPHTISAGQKTPEGVVLVSSGGDGAVLDIDGKRRSLRLGEAYAAAPSAASSGDGESVTLTADSGGHFHGLGTINGHSARFMVDTGASMIWLSSDLADQLGVSWRNGKRFVAQTAGGNKEAWAITLQSVRVGGVTLHDVGAAVGEGAGTGDTFLLGMTYLSRLTMFRDGSRLTLSSKEGAAANPNDHRARLVIKDNGHGSFATMVALNGMSLPFIVDTGATDISIDSGMAQQIGLNYEKGTPGVGSTANGLIKTWRVTFDSVTVGPITLYGVQGSVREGGSFGGVGLLGMSFLNRLEMHRDGEAMTLIKRF